MLSIAEGNVRNPSVADAKQACEKNSSSKGDSAHSMRFLPDGFEPGEHDVLCGRGRKCFNHPGNVKFREIVLSYLAQYSKAMTKLEKSYILSDVVEKVRKDSGIGGFVKKNEDGRWYEVGDFLAREKTSQAFRDVLHDKYKSSNTSKKKRRQEEQAEKLFRAHSNRSLDCGASVHTANSTHSEFSSQEKFMRIDRPEMIAFSVEEPSPDDLLGALDKELANSFGGRKGLASQRSQRSVMEFDKRQTMLKQAKSGPSWYNHSCPNLLRDSKQPPAPPSSGGVAMDQHMDQHMDHLEPPPPVSQIVFEDSVMEPTPFESHMDTIDGSFQSGSGPPPTTAPQYRNEWLHHSQPNLFANIHNPVVQTRRRQFARMPPRRQGSARDILSRQGSGRNLMSRQGSGRNLMSRQGSGRNLLARQGSGRNLLARQGSAQNVMSMNPGSRLMDNSSHHTPMNNHSSPSNHSRHSMTVFEEQLDSLALSDRGAPQPQRPAREEPEDINVNDIVLSPMAGETKESLLASLASLSDSFAIEPIEENPFEPVPLQH